MKQPQKQGIILFGGDKMNCDKMGALIQCLRKEKGYTQKTLADILNISDRTVSKWERGLSLN